jgi:hypothetical protein
MKRTFDHRRWTMNDVIHLGRSEAALPKRARLEMCRSVTEEKGDISTTRSTSGVTSIHPQLRGGNRNSHTLHGAVTVRQDNVERWAAREVYDGQATKRHNL